MDYMTMIPFADDRARRKTKLAEHQDIVYCYKEFRLAG